MNILLTREDFKKIVFERDKHKCVVCGQPAVDAHHIIDRALWTDGGYYLDNGVSLCNGKKGQEIYDTSKLKFAPIPEKEKIEKYIQKIHVNVKV